LPALDSRFWILASPTEAHREGGILDIEDNWDIEFKIQDQWSSIFAKSNPFPEPKIPEKFSIIFFQENSMANDFDIRL
jgi:hypothetical protein